MFLYHCIILYGIRIIVPAMFVMLHLPFWANTYFQGL
jgi:hypothetical protein